MAAMAALDPVGEQLECTSHMQITKSDDAHDRVLSANVSIRSGPRLFAGQSDLARQKVRGHRAMKPKYALALAMEKAKTANPAKVALAMEGLTQDDDSGEVTLRADIPEERVGCPGAQGLHVAKQFADDRLPFPIYCSPVCTWSSSSSPC
jgi:hypothetical protein